MKTRTTEDTVKALNETHLPNSIGVLPQFKSIQSAALVLAQYPSPHTYMHFKQAIWKMYGYLDCRVDMQKWNRETEGKVRIFLNRMDSFFD